MTVKNFDEFIESRLGKAIDDDGAAGAQCVDLIKGYLRECFGIRAGSWGNARCYFERFDDPDWDGFAPMNERFTLIFNTPDFVPMKGDIGVFGAAVAASHSFGHVCLCTGDGARTYFYSYDQNWNGKSCQKICHRYTAFLGVLRPKRRVSEALNVRTGPGIGYRRVTELPKGTLVNVQESRCGWFRIAPDRWVSGKYLEMCW